jgi:tetratricopeptide (TPR) repeat protein
VPERVEANKASTLVVSLYKPSRLSQLSLPMKNLRPILAVISLNLFAFGAVSILPATSVMAAANDQKVGAKVGKPLQDALTAGQAKQWDQALTKLREADAVPDKTPFEQFKINEIFAWVYTSQKKYGEAAAIYEKLIDSPFVSPTEADQYIKNVAQMYLQTNNNTKAMDYLQRWLKAHPGDADMTAILGQLQSKTGQLKQSLDTFNGLVSASEKAGQKPKEDWLKIMFRVSYQLGGSTNSLDKQTLGIVEKLLRYYPNESYWQSMLAGLKQQQTTDAGRFQLDRLMLAVGTLKDPNDFIEFAQLANNFGYPGEALSVLDAGYSKGILGTSASKDREDRLKATIQKLADADKAALPALDKKARAAATGQDDVSLGEAYYGYGRYQEAIEALERGIKKGGLKKPDQAQLALGISYLRAGQAEKARAEFKKVPSDSEYDRIADLWILHSANAK